MYALNLMIECHLSFEEKVVLREAFSYSDDSETMNMVAAILSISTNQEEEEDDEEEDLLFNEDSNDDQRVTITEDSWSDDEYAVIKAYYEEEEEEDWLEIRTALGIAEDLDSGQINGEQKVTMEDISRLTLKKVRM